MSENSDIKKPEGPKKSEEKPKQLTPDDPISPEVIQRIRELEDARLGIAIQLLGLEEDRVRLLAAAHQVSEQKNRLFEQILMERGLPPQARVEIDSETGALVVLDEKP